MTLCSILLLPSSAAPSSMQCCVPVYHILHCHKSRLLNTFSFFGFFFSSLFHLVRFPWDIQCTPDFVGAQPFSGERRVHRWLQPNYNSLLTAVIYSLPSGMKVAKVVPVHKSKEKYIFNNCRPISVLPVLSAKILERVAYKPRYIKGYGFLNNNNQMQQWSCLPVEAQRLLA